MLAHGFGSEVSSERTVYSGQWSGGFRSGLGTLYYQDSQQPEYVGQFKRYKNTPELRIISRVVPRDVKWGQGILYYPSGKYIGKTDVRMTNYNFLTREDDVQWRDET